MGPSSLTRRHLRFLTIATLAVALPIAPLRAAVSAPLPSRESIGQILAQLAELCGMRVRRQLRFASISRAEVARYLDARTRETTRPEDLDRQEAALEMLGFLPVGFDMRKLTVDLMTEQAAAFYDYNKKALFLSDWAPGPMRDTATIHELAHALADQNYPLRRYSRQAAASSEASTARQAVIEGQASYLMFAYAALTIGTASAELHPDPAAFDQSVAPSGQYPVFDGAPLYVRMGLIFPYTWGLSFQSALVDRLGRDGFSAPFRHAPVSTQQILHPELYFTDRRPRVCEVPKPPKGFRELYSGELGELDHRILIQQYASLEAAKRVSPEWRGGSFRIVENKADRARMLFYASEWSDEKNAAGFLLLYRKCLEGKSVNMHVEQDDGQSFSGRNSRGFFRATRNGTRIDAIEGSPTRL